jgi:hypothetical protein
MVPKEQGRRAAEESPHPSQDRDHDARSGRSRTTAYVDSRTLADWRP